MQLMNHCRDGLDCLDYSLPSWDRRLPLLLVAREGMVPVTANHLLHCHNPVAGLCGGATCTHFVDLLQDNSSERTCGPCFTECEELMANEHYIWVL